MVKKTTENVTTTQPTQEVEMPVLEKKTTTRTATKKVDNTKAKTTTKSTKSETSSLAEEPKVQPLVEETVNSQVETETLPKEEPVKVVRKRNPKATTTKEKTVVEEKVEETPQQETLNKGEPSSATPLSTSTAQATKSETEILDVKVIDMDSPEEIVEEKGPLLVTEAKKNKKKRKKIKISEKDIVRYDPSIKEGLTDNQVNERISDGLVNVVSKTNEKTILKIILTNTFTFFNTLCFILAAILIWIYVEKGIMKENLTNMLFIVIIFCNLLIGIVQEIKAKLMINKIKLISSPTAKVIRESEEREIMITDLVLDDIIVLTPGKQIPADSIVLEGEIEANESLLTGESVPVKKKKNAELYSGSFVVSGKAKAKVEKIGDECYNAKLAASAKQYKKPDSQLMKSMSSITKFIGIIVLPLALLTLIDLMSNYAEVDITRLFTKESLEQIWAVLPVIMGRLAASIIGMMPAGMFLLTSMALAVGVIKLAKKRTLVHDLYSIEMLARSDVLCLDKTGTITDGTMEVKNVTTLDVNYATSMYDIIGSMLTALNDNNQTTIALANEFGYNKEYTAKTIIPFSSARKFSAVTFRNGETYMYGAPEYVLKTRNPDIEKQVKIQTKKGFRVLMFAKCEGEIVDNKISTDRKPIALIIIEDHIRENAKATIKWFKDNGVDIKVISGDNPMTVSEVSKSVGIEKAEQYISLAGFTEQQVIDAADQYTVFGRVTPEQKRTLVKALKAKNHKVAMTGDGVNDILALKEADCSIAMASGTEAARNVSNLVLLDNDFGAMPSVVAEGRRVVNNVQNSASIFLVKTMFIIMIVLFYLMLPNESFPFQPRNFLMIELFMSGLPTFFLALQPNDDIIKGNFFANLISKVIPGGLTMVFNIILCYVANILLQKVSGLTLSHEFFMTMCCLVLIFTGMIILFETCKPINFYRGLLLTIDFSLLFFTMFVLPELITFNLGFTPFKMTDISQLVYTLITALILLLSCSVYRNLLKLSTNLKEKIVN
ncbi:MAG: HAD-IC family P-type ATPase [Clostridia bacterium]|nr:HAD-IC family P-type ATPase [Clostridia bacterium]